MIAAGGTAGHVVPALAVADELRTDGSQVVFAGGARAEAQLVPAAGFELVPFRVQGLSRTNPLKALAALGQAVAATVRAWRLIGSLRPDAVMGGGGYVAGPVGLAAVLRRRPLVLTEADSHLGLTNRLLAPFARRVGLAFAIPGRTPPRYVVTGRPIPPPAGDRGAARAHFGVPEGRPLVVVVGGSLGARSINEAAIEAFGQDGEVEVIHAAGDRDLPSLRQRPVGPGYRLFGYIDDFDQALAAADLVVSRSGGSVFEIAAAGCPAVLVPYPYAAADHQAGNAAWMGDAGAAVVIDDDRLDAALLASTVRGLLDEPGRLAQMREASLSIARPGAAAAVAGLLREAAA
ncbi:MAG: UDP-N-acetylglucosamine--N-acetylmuramyl-(pentapeptide) pyrophosphoryl-undecaprenol N-acetylglucosamine transferase [Solirubrobacterales bacterium]